MLLDTQSTVANLSTGSLSEFLEFGCILINLLNLDLHHSYDSSKRVEEPIGTFLKIRGARGGLSNEDPDFPLARSSHKKIFKNQFGQLSSTTMNTLSKIIKNSTIYQSPFLQL